MNNAEILVIDDELQICKLLEITLQSNDYKVSQAYNGKDGIIMAANHPPDLILLDIGLPDMSGHEVLRKIREWYYKPIIILSEIIFSLIGVFIGFAIIFLGMLLYDTFTSPLLSFSFYGHSVLDPGRQVMDSYIPRSSGLGRLTLIAFLFFHLLKEDIFSYVIFQKEVKFPNLCDNLSVQIS